MPSKMTIWDFADSCGNVTVEDVAKVYGVHTNTVRKWIESGLLPHKRLPSGRRMVITADDVDWFDAKHMGAASSI